MTPQRIEFSPEIKERFEKLLKKYEVRRSALLPTLYLAQEQFSYLSPPVMDYVATLLDLPPKEVYEAVSFYTLFRKKDMGKWCLQVCNNITCTMMGSESLIKIIGDNLKIKAHEVTPDGLFSYLPVQCLGSCGTAPVVQVNETYYENQSPERFKTLLEELAKK